MSEVAFGSMQFGGKMNLGNLGQEETTRMVKLALDHGINFQSFAEYHDIGILAWSPLAGGFLTGKYSRNNPPPAGSRFADAN